MYLFYWFHLTAGLPSLIRGVALNLGVTYRFIVLRQDLNRHFRDRSILFPSTTRHEALLGLVT